MNSLPIGPAKYEALRRLGDRYGYPVLEYGEKITVPSAVIMITAFANLDVAIEALRDDVYDFFPKPVKIKDLKASIKRALSREQAGG